MKKKIGFFSSNVVRALGLDIEPGTPIYVADSNIEHIKKSHPTDFEKYGNELSNSMYVLNPNRVKNFIQKGTLKKLDK